MPSTIVLALALTGPLPLESLAAASDAPRSLEEIRSAYRAALQQTAPRKRPDYGTVVPRAVHVYAELATADGLSHSERSQMQGRLKVRLEEIRGRLARNELAVEQAAARVRYRSRASRDVRASREGNAATLAGPLDSRQAQELIDLIQNTIAPESWEVNGGRGSIRYYSPLQALVVRQTGEVHHQLNAGLGQLRK